MVGVSGVCYLGVLEMETISKFFQAMYKASGFIDFLILVLLLVWMLLDRMEIYFK